MSITSNYLQLTEMNKRKHTIFHHEILVEDKPDAALTTYPKELTQHSKETKQSVLLLNGARQQYSLVTDYAVPSILHDGEILVKVMCLLDQKHRRLLTLQVVAIGLNPIDWKGPYVHYTP